MKKIETKIHGCYLLELFSINDHRGRFLKTYNEDRFKELGLPTDWKEDFFSLSSKGTLRGMHFQLPPHEQIKVVSCLRGKILDVVLDLRVGSPSFGVVDTFELSGSDALALYLPEGIAHGFLAEADDSLVYYKASKIHNAISDSGIHWKSIPFQWSVNPITISQRDENHPKWSDFESPFYFN
tara:strand:- start:5523 stop:6068 length:546 start_codon:yes stop_codon:yes gene_type:complete